MLNYEEQKKYIIGSMVLEGAIICVFLFFLSEPGLLSKQFADGFWGVIALILGLLVLELAELNAIKKQYNDDFNPPV